MEYLFKITLISSVIYLFYKLFLQKETFFQSIRLYFILGIIVSIILPLLIIPIYVEVAPIVPSEVIEITKSPEIPDFTNIKTPVKMATPIDWQFWLSTFYFIGVAFFFLQFILELFSLMRLIKISKKIKKGIYKFVETNAEVSPFSFFNYIVYNKKHFKEKELKSIIEHEKVHINQQHSLDNILVQLFVIIQWFNPFVWLYKKDLQQNLEYIADEVAQEKAETHKKYQYLLLKTSIKNNPFALSNNFFNSQLKKRILMLQKSQTKKLNQVKYALLIPLVALFLYSFNTKEVFIQKEASSLNYSDKIIVIDVGHGGKDPGAISNGISEKDIVLSISKKVKQLYNGNATIILTRNNDEFISLEDRFKKVNNLKPDLLISLHVNASSNKEKKGLITYISKENPNPEISEKVANILMAKFSKTNLKCEFLSLSNLKMLTKVDCPAVLVEAGYLTNTSDRAYINSNKGQNDIAKSIVNFINGEQNTQEDLNFISPINKKDLTQMASGYGMRVHPFTKEKEMHNGMDFTANKGTAVLASANGVVVNAEYDRNYGNVVYINHKNGFQTRYANMHKILVEKGSQITQGTILGEVGTTGKSVAPHLHFEVLIDGKNVNPIDYLPMGKTKKAIHNAGSSKYSISTNSQNNFKPIFKRKTIITSKTTKEEMKLFNNMFKNKSSKIKIVNVKRDKDDEIKSFAIKTKFKNQDRFYTNMRIKPKHIVIGDFAIEKVKNKEAFKIKNNDNEIKHYSIIDKDGVKLYFDEDIRLKNNLSNEESKINKGNLVTKFKEPKITPKSGQIYYDKKTYYYLENKDIITFYDRYGNEISEVLSKTLLKKLQKKRQEIQRKRSELLNKRRLSKLEVKRKSKETKRKELKSRVEKIYRNRLNQKNRKETQNERSTLVNKKQSKGWVYHNKKAYFYSKNKDTFTFYDRHGNEISEVLSKTLLIYLKQERKNLHSNYQEQTAKDKIMEAHTMTLRKTLDNESSKFIIVNDEKYTIDEAQKIKLPIKNFTIDIKTIESSELHGNVSDGTTMKIKDEKGIVRIVTFGGHFSNKKPVLTKMGWLYYTMNNVDYEGYYFKLNSQTLLFDEKGIPLNKDKTKQINTLLLSIK